MYEHMANSIQLGLAPLYKKLHAYLRFKLAEKYPELVDRKGLIPVHLTQDMFGLTWIHLLDILQPYEVKPISLLHLHFTFNPFILSTYLCCNARTKQPRNICHRAYMSEKDYDGQSGLMSAEIKITAPNICFQFPIEKFLLTKDVYINKPYQFSIIQN